MPDDPDPRRSEHDYACDSCGSPAGTILVLAPGAPLPERPGPDMSGLYGEESWVLDVEHHGRGAVQWPCDPDQAGVIDGALAGWDFAALRRIDAHLATFICRQCELPYCIDHMPVSTVLEPGGAPMYDYYFEARCPRGHRFTFERN